MKIELKKESWEWFFDTIFNNKNTIERTDGKSLGDFWAIVQHAQEQFLNEAPAGFVMELLKDLQKPALKSPKFYDPVKFSRQMGSTPTNSGEAEDKAGSTPAGDGKAGELLCKCGHARDDHNSFDRNADDLCSKCGCWGFEEK